MMDNFHIDVISKGDLTYALAIAFAHAPAKCAKGYLVEERDGELDRLIFFWNDDLPAAPLPFKLDAEGAVDFTRRWLAEQDYGEQPDHDGDNTKGWRVYTEDWGRIEGYTYSFVAIEPAWAMHGK